MNHSDDLTPLLRAWRHTPPPAPQFAEGVRARLSAAAPARAPFLRWLAPLPFAASLTVLLAGATGTTAAFALNHARANDRMAAAYARSIDPLQMTAPSSHP